MTKVIKMNISGKHHHNVSSKFSNYFLVINFAVINFCDDKNISRMQNIRSSVHKNLNFANFYAFITFFSYWNNKSPSLYFAYVCECDSSHLAASHDTSQRHKMYLTRILTIILFIKIPILKELQGFHEKIVL